MLVGVCKFSIDLSEGFSPKARSHFIQQIKQKILARYKIFLAEVSGADESVVVIGFSMAAREEHSLREIIDKILVFIEEKEGIRIEQEKTQIFQF